MADVIKSDIEKIERALNIRVEDVEIEVALNAGQSFEEFSSISIGFCFSAFTSEYSRQFIKNRANR